MIKRALFLLTLFTVVANSLFMAQESASAQPHHLSLEEAVQLALQHNHLVRIAAFKVEENEHARYSRRYAHSQRSRSHQPGIAQHLDRRHGSDAAANPAFQNQGGE